MNKISKNFSFLNFPLQFYQFWSIILLIKVIVVLWIGFHYEQDTPRYLLNIRHLYNPPLYSIILRIITKIYVSLNFTIIFQTIVFTTIISYFSIRNKHNQIIWALFWSFEPISAFYCSNLMSEWLFIALLFACYLEWKNYQLNPNYQNLMIFVSTVFFLYMTRYIGITFFIFFIFFEIYLYLFEKTFMRIKHIIVSVMIFFILSIPIRVVNFYTFNTFSINAYNSLNLWNSVSVLYPNSNIQNNPTSKFEKYLSTFPDSIFSTQNALFTHQMWVDTLPANQFAIQNNLSPVEMDKILKSTSFNLIFEESWIKYFQKFIFPNCIKPFILKRENIGIEGTYFYIENFFGKHRIPNFQYYYEWIALLSLVLIINLLMHKIHFLNLYLIFYWLFIILTSAVFMRYLYAIIPLAFFAFLEILQDKNKKKVEFIRQKKYLFLKHRNSL